MDETSQVLASADPPIHTLHRKTVFPSLVARRMASIEPDIRDLASRAVSDFVEDGGGDFMPAIGLAVPISVISQLIGFRDSDPDKLLQAAFDSTMLVGATISHEEIDRLFERSLEISLWITEQIGTGGAAEDVLLGTIAAGIEAGDLSEGQGATILHTLLSAGGESTSSLLGNAVGRLAADEELQNRIRQDPERIPTFIEEVLRLESPFRQQMRSVPTGTSLGGVDIPAGSTVLVFFSSANRDPAEFERADELRFDRKVPKAHVAFGRGIHHCVGAPLARLEAGVVIRELLAATSSIRLDPDRPAQRVDSLLVWRYDRLPLIVE
jgi:cytochrome P450